MSVKDAVAETMTVRGLGWWLVAGGVLTATIVYPIAAGATVCVDDFTWVTIAYGKPFLWESLADGWHSHLFYRPFDVVANRLVSACTLTIWPIILLQTVGFAWLALGMRRFVRLAGFQSSIPWLIAVAWLLFHPSTQLSLWSAGTLSQTLCAAAGVWLIGLIALHETGRPWKITTCKLLLVSCIGILAKELFVGWATCGALLLVAREWITVKEHVTSTPNAFLKALFLRLPQVMAVLGPSVVFLTARIATSQLAAVAGATAGPKYNLHGPEVVLTNITLAFAGMFVQGPVHWMTLRSFPHNAVPLIGVGLSFLMALEGSRKIVLGSTSRHLRRWHLLAVAIVAGLCSVWPALLIGHFSELYVMGANALVAILVGIGLAAAIRDSMPAGSHASKTVCAIAVMVLWAVAAVGAVSRAYHFRVTWQNARAIRNGIQQTLDSAATGSIVRFSVPLQMRNGVTHSKYIVPPVVAANPPRAAIVRKLTKPDSAEALFDWPIIPPDYAGEAVVADPPLLLRELW